MKVCPNCGERFKGRPRGRCDRSHMQAITKKRKAGFGRGYFGPEAFKRAHGRPPGRADFARSQDWERYLAEKL